MDFVKKRIEDDGLKDCQPIQNVAQKEGIQNHSSIRVLLKEGIQNNMYAINLLKSFQNILT
jgi:hypothetical protein